MSAAIVAAAPFRYPDDWRASGETRTDVREAAELVLDITRDHYDEHGFAFHPWCLTCEVLLGLPEPTRLATARTALGGSEKDYADVLDDVASLVNGAGLAPVDLERLATDHGLDVRVIRDVVEYAFALDELLAAADARAADGVELTCRARVSRWVRLGRPVPRKSPDADGGGYASQVAAEALRLRIRDDAKELHAKHKAASDPAEPFDAGLLADILARPAEPPHRVAGLIPADASTLVVAQRKTGKTTFILNLVRALTTGEDFLDEFTVLPLDGRIAVLNYEVSAAQVGRWADDAGIDPQRLYLVNLRGRRNPLAHPADRAVLAARLRELEVETLIVDPFANAYTGVSQNDAGEVGAWLRDLDRFARSEVGARDLVLTVHAGWNADRTRGASALEDWADSIITLTKDDQDNRYLRAIGRDVDVAEDGLLFDHLTRRLTLARTGSRKAKLAGDRSEFLVSAVHGVVTASPGLNGSQIEDTLRRQGVGAQKGEGRKALAAAVAAGLLHVQNGSRGSKLYYPTDLPRRTPTYPTGAGATYPDPPSKEGGYVSGHLDTLTYPEANGGAA